MNIFIRLDIELDDAFPSLFTDVDDGPDGVPDFNGAPDFETLPRSNEALPASGADDIDTEDLAGFVIGKETGRDDAGVVQDKQIVFIHERREI